METSSAWPGPSFLPAAFVCPQTVSSALQESQLGLNWKICFAKFKASEKFRNCNSNRTHGNKWELELLCNRQIGAFNQSKADKSKSFAKGPTLFCFVGTEKVFEHSGFPKSSDIPPTAKRIFKAFTEFSIKISPFSG